MHHSQMVTEEDIRRVALSLPGSVQKPYNRLPSFRVRGTCSSGFTSCPMPSLHPLRWSGGP